MAWVIRCCTILTLSRDSLVMIRLLLCIVMVRLTLRELRCGYQVLVDMGCLVKIMLHGAAVSSLTVIKLMIDMVAWWVPTKTRSTNCKSTNTEQKHNQIASPEIQGKILLLQLVRRTPPLFWGILGGRESLSSLPVRGASGFMVS